MFDPQVEAVFHAFPEYVNHEPVIEFVSLYNHFPTCLWHNVTLFREI
jgi:hypothetical protein